MKKLWIVLLSACLLLLAACSNNASTASYGTVTDILGNQVTIEEPHTKIVSLAPAATEIIYAIGAEDYLLANTIYCDYPQAANDKPKIGDFYNPNVELILSYEPDLIFTASGVQEDLVQQFKDLGITVFCLDAYTVEDVLKNIAMAGQLTGRQEQAEQVVSEMEASLNTVASKVAAHSEVPSVFVEIWDEPLMTAGAPSFVGDMIKHAGGNNIAANMQVEYPEFSKEQLLAADPAVYILASHDHEVADVTSRAGFSALQAVQNNRVYKVDDDIVTLCGPRIVEGIELLYNCIYGE